MGRDKRLAGLLKKPKFDQCQAGLTLGFAVAGVDGFARLGVLDVDHPEHLSSDLLAALENWPWRVSTPRGGWHAYVQLPVGRRFMGTRHLPWGDFLSDKSYCLAPGNVTVKGVYRPQLGFGVGNLPSAPPELLEALLARPENPQQPKPKAGQPTSRDSRTIATPTAGVTEGRHMALFDVLRAWAYRQPRGDDLDQWISRVKQQAVSLAEQFGDRTDFPDSEARAIGYRVADWIWSQEWRDAGRGNTVGKRNTQGLGIVSIKDFQDKQGYRAVLSHESRRLEMRPATPR